MEDDPTDDQQTATSWTNPWIAEYKRRQAMLMEMRPFEVIAMTRDLNLTSYAFSKNTRGNYKNRIWRYPEFGQSQPFNPDVGDPFGIELVVTVVSSSGVMRRSGCREVEAAQERVVDRRRRG